MSVYIQDVLVRKRLFWMQEVNRLGVNAACRKLGIYKSHYYYWSKRYLWYGIEGLKNHPTTPKVFPRISKPSLVSKILDLRAETERGADTIALLLLQRFGLRVSRSTVNKILQRSGKITKATKPFKKKHKLRYQASVPGERVQIDVKYVPYRVQTTSGRAYQYTAIDDCTRVRFAKIYDGHGIYYLMQFLEDMLAFLPFKVRLIQTDNHVIFTYKYTAHKRAFLKLPKEHALEKFCRDHGIKHHLIEPGEPALNGKVERSHRTDQAFFYDYHRISILGLLQAKFLDWIDHYNHQRPHWAHAGQTPAQRLQALGYKLGRISYGKKISYSLAA